MAYHRCQCGYETELSNGNSVFDSEIHCQQCAFSVSESDMKISNDLASMMSGFTIDTLHNQPHDVSMPPTPQVVPHEVPTTYISQHYTHSAHVAPKQYSETSVSDALTEAGVNASALLPSQIQLFRHAQPDQQARLIQLWRIAPPTYGNQLQAQHLGNWPSTSLEMEEEAARARWERTESEKLKNLCAPQSAREVAEPYMSTGYQNLAHFHGENFSTNSSAAQSNIAENRNSREWWKMSENEPIEHQYGMVQQMQLQNLQLDSEDQEML